MSGRALADEGDDALVRMGGEVAVPLPEHGPRAPDEVLITPNGGPAIARMEAGGFVVWDPQRGATTVLPLLGEHLLTASHNGGSVLTGGADGKVTRWRTGTWKPMAELQVEGAVEEARFSLDGHHLLVASKGPDGRRFTLFGGAVGLALKRLDRADAALGAPIAVATGKIAFPAKQDRVLAVYALPRLEGLREIALDDDDPIRALAFASETELVAIQSGSITRWDTETGKALGAVRLPEKCARLALSGDGRLVVCAPISEKGAPVAATLLDAATGAVRTTFMVPGRGAPVFDPKGLRVALPGNSAVPIWEVTIDGVSTVLPTGAVAGSVRGLSLVGGKVVALEEGYLRAWDPATQAEAWRLSTTAISMAPMGDGRLALAGESGLSLYDPATGAVVVIDAKKKLAAVAGAGDVMAVLDPQGGVFVRKVGDKKAVVAMPRLRGGRKPIVRGLPGVLAASWDGGALFAEGRLASLPVAKSPKAELVAKDARLATWLGSRLVVVEGDVPRFAGTDDQRALAAVVGVTTIAGSADGRWLALGSGDGRVVVLDGSGAVRFERVAHHGAVTALVFDLAANRLYSAGADGPSSLILGWPLPKL